LSLFCVKGPSRERERERERRREGGKEIPFITLLRKIPRGTEGSVFITILDKRSVEREEGRDGGKGIFHFTLLRKISKGTKYRLVTILRKRTVERERERRREGGKKISFFTSLQKILKGTEGFLFITILDKTSIERAGGKEIFYFAKNSKEPNIDLSLCWTKEAL